MRDVKHIQHPGPVDLVRIDSFAGAARTLDVWLAAEVSLLDAVAGPMTQAGLTAGCLRFERLRFNPFRYVIPAFSPDADHVAFYSATHAPEGTVETIGGTLTYGSKDGAPFLHCHALWLNASGQIRGGHILPSDAILAEPGKALAFGTSDMQMVSRFDPETNFTLFRPVQVQTLKCGPKHPRCIMARIKPNVDLVSGIEEVCRQHGVGAAVIRSGIGSIVGAELEDGQIVPEHPTEILVLEGRITPDDRGQPQADLKIAVIDTRGHIHKGRPARGRNPVLICFEVALEPIQELP